MQRWFLFLANALVAVTMIAAETPPYAPPKPPADARLLGHALQRTMTLLATSTPQQRRTVKVLFYGQSITQQAWWKSVAEDLRHRFPNANLIIENRAIGGFASQLLVKTAETDLYPFYPDLLIFHVYGSHIEYENIIRRVRERTTAEILMQTDHITKDQDILEETDPAKLTTKQWNAFMNHSFLPATARKYGAELCDQHGAWKQYLTEHQLKAADLLKDGVHLNAQGEYLMAELVKPYLRYDPALPKDSWRDLVGTYLVGSYLMWRKDTLTFTFTGNRVDLVLREGPRGSPAVKVLIDGRKPSEFPELYGFTATTPFPQSDWPCLLRVTSQAPLVLEDWTLTFTEPTENMKDFKFEVIGSKTGPDGTGSRNEKFVSKSGRVVIDPADWNLDYAFQVFKRKLPEGFRIAWKVVPYFTDEVTAPEIKDPTVETTVTLAQGLANTKHQLKLIGGTNSPIASVRVYHPPLGP